MIKLSAARRSLGILYDGELAIAEGRLYLTSPAEMYTFGLPPAQAGTGR